MLLMIPYEAHEVKHNRKKECEPCENTEHTGCNKRRGHETDALIEIRAPKIGLVDAGRFPFPPRILKRVGSRAKKRSVVHKYFFADDKCALPRRTHFRLRNLK